MCGKLKRVSLFSSQVKAGLQIVENGRSSKYWNQTHWAGRVSKSLLFVPSFASLKSFGGFKLLGLEVPFTLCVTCGASLDLKIYIFRQIGFCSFCAIFTGPECFLFELYEHLPRPPVLQRPRHLWDFQSSRSSGLLSCWAPWAGKILLKVNFYVAGCAP